MRPRTTHLAAALALSAMLTLAGCHHHKRHHRHFDPPHPSATSSLTSFTWSGDDLFGYSAEDVYEWDTVWDEVFIEFTAYDFHGEIRIQIFDDFFHEIFDETYFGFGGDVFVNTISELGFAGEWTIVINTYDVDGDVTLRLD